MYHAEVIAARTAAIERDFGSALPTGHLIRTPVAVCHANARALAPLWDPQRGVPTRPFTREEDAFVANERLLTKVDFRYFAERYWLIQSEGQSLKPLYPLWESQTLFLAELAHQEQLRWSTHHPDGLLCNILKGRQLGVSTCIEALVGHRICTQTYVKALVASDVPANSGSQGIFGMLELGFDHLPWWLKPGVKLRNVDSHLVLANGSSVIVESGKSMKGGLQDEGGQKGQLGRSKTYSCAHLTELSTWEYPETIDDALMPAVPSTPRTLMCRESTAKGRHNWWHEEWLVTTEGLGRCFNVFIPWYAERSKYWLPPPPTWVPTSDTLAFAKRVEDKGAQFMRRPIILDREQLYWYESRRAEAVRKEHLYKFLEEYPAEPEEAFQYSGRSIFSIETMDRLERQARPLADVWRVAPAADLAADKDALVRELAESNLRLTQQQTTAKLRAEATLNNDPQPQIVEQAIPGILTVPSEADR